MTSPIQSEPGFKSFRVRLVQGWKIVLAMVLPPLLILPCIYLLSQFRGLSEPVVFTVIGAIVISVCGASIWLVFRCISSVDYSVEGERHRVTVLRPNLLNVRSFDFAVDDVRGFRVRQYKGRLDFTVTTCRYPGKFSINSASDRPDDVERFKELLLLMATQLDERNAGDAVSSIRKP